MQLWVNTPTTVGVPDRLAQRRDGETRRALGDRRQVYRLHDPKRRACRLLDFPIVAVGIGIRVVCTI